MFPMRTKHSKMALRSEGVILRTFGSHALVAYDRTPAYSFDFADRRWTPSPWVMFMSFNVDRRCRFASPSVENDT